MSVVPARAPRMTADAGGLTPFGAHPEPVMPGSRSLKPFWPEDAVLHVPDRPVSAVDGDGDHGLTPCMAACWPRGAARGHTLRNRSDTPALHVNASTPRPDDPCPNPDIDLITSRRNAVRLVAHQDGTPYPGWPNGAPK